MELTFNTSPTEWYVETIDNDFTYWRIDYPPLTAYVSWIFGYLSYLYEPNSVELFKSRGYETPSHKVFMRATLIVSDFIFFFSGVFALMNLEGKKYSRVVRAIFIFFAINCPLFILIDHGHF